MIALVYVGEPHQTYIQVGTPTRCDAFGGLILGPYGGFFGLPHRYFVGEWGYEADVRFTMAVTAQLIDYYVRARTYDPVVARWLSRDPLGFVDGVNLFTYCLNSPLNFLDPSGTELVAPWNPRAKWWFGLDNPFENKRKPPARRASVAKAAAPWALPDIKATMGMKAFGVLPIQIAPPGGIFLRADGQIKAGCCTCPNGQRGLYERSSASFEFGIYTGFMTPGWHVATPLVETLGECPPERSKWDGDINVRVVVGPVIGTCFWSARTLNYSCTASLRWTQMWALSFNLQVSGKGTYSWGTNTC